MQSAEQLLGEIENAISTFIGSDCEERREQLLCEYLRTEGRSGYVKGLGETTGEFRAVRSLIQSLGRMHALFLLERMGLSICGVDDFEGDHLRRYRWVKIEVEFAVPDTPEGAMLARTLALGFKKVAATTGSGRMYGVENFLRRKCVEDGAASSGGGAAHPVVNTEI